MGPREAGDSLARDLVGVSCQTGNIQRGWKGQGGTAPPQASGLGPTHPGAPALNTPFPACQLLYPQQRSPQWLLALGPLGAPGKISKFREGSRWGAGDAAGRRHPLSPLPTQQISLACPHLVQGTWPSPFTHQPPRRRAQMLWGQTLTWTHLPALDAFFGQFPFSGCQCPRL